MPPTHLRTAQESGPRTDLSLMLNLALRSSTVQSQLQLPPPEHLFTGWAMGVTSAALNRKRLQNSSAASAALQVLADQKPHKAQPQLPTAAWQTLRTS